MLSCKKNSVRSEYFPELAYKIVRWIDPVLQPRFAMGMAMTVLSFAMLGRFAGIEIRQLKPSDLDPAKVWMTIEDRAVRTWERGVKYYQSMRLVYDVQTRLSEWNDLAEADKRTTAGKNNALKPTRPRHWRIRMGL